MKTDKQTYAFVYKWIELSTGKWYIGSHGSKGCHPNDGYICSSKVVKPLIKHNPNNWTRKILCIGHPYDMYTLESRLLQQLDAKNDKLSYNETNNDRGEFSFVKKNHSDNSKLKISNTMKGRPAHNKGIPGKTGIKKSAETINKIKQGKQLNPGRGHAKITVTPAGQFKSRNDAAEYYAPIWNRSVYISAKRILSYIRDDLNTDYYYLER